MALQRVTNDHSGQKIFTVTYEDIRPKTSRNYTYFSANTVVTVQGDYTGDLLDGTYTHTDLNKRLVQKGDFKKGLKTGIWHTWHPNGKTKSLTRYSMSGRRVGKYSRVDQNGTLQEVGNYRKGYKSGKWIVQGDTLFFKRGVDITAEKKSKVPLFKRLFTKTSKNKKTSSNTTQENFLKKTWNRLFKKNLKNKSNKKSRRNDA